MTLTLGTAPDSWGVWFADSPLQTPWSRFLDEVAEVGYRWIELGPYGYLPTDLSTLRGELDQRDLRVAAGAVMFALEDEAALADARAEIESVCTILENLGAGYLLVIDDVYTDLVSGVQRAPAVLDDAHWAQLIASVEAIASTAATHGLTTLLHPHAQTHVESEEEIERFLADAPTEVGLCLDLGHHAYTGADPVPFLERHHTRIPYLHLKSLDPSLGSAVTSDGVSFAEAVADGLFVEPELGVVDFVALGEVLDRIGYEGFGIVEQDMYPAPFDRPLPIARRTRAYLEQIGLGSAASHPTGVRLTSEPTMRGTPEP